MAISTVIIFAVSIAGVSTLAIMAAEILAGWGKAYASYDAARLPSVDVGLVLGTLIYSHYFRGPNPTFIHRLDAAAELWRAGKVRYLIVSGNGEDTTQDEPTVMRDLLVQRGVPAEVIYRDFAGLRTVTSIVHARDIYGQKRLIVVSQHDHVSRALFLARHLGVEAWGYNAPEAALPPQWDRPLRNKLVMLYAYWDLIIGSRAVVGRRVAIGVDRPG